MLELTTETFKKEIEEGKGYAVVDFFTTSCGPCRAIAPVFKSQAEKNKDYKFGKIEAENGHDMFVKYDVRYVPTLIAFQDGKEVSRKGFMSEKELEAWLKETFTEKSTTKQDTSESKAQAPSSS